MKRILLTLIVLALPSLSSAASADSTHSGRANSLRGGVWALQFAITDFVSLDEFDGGVSLKRHFSDRSALRLGVDGGAGSSSSESELYYEQEADNDSYRVRVSAIYQRYINPTAEANFYWGVGAIVGYQSSSREAVADSSSRYNEASTTDVGAQAIAGIEWFATRVISLHAEYSGAVFYSKREATDEQRRTGYQTITYKEESDGWSTGLGGVRFGLSVYF